MLSGVYSLFYGFLNMNGFIISFSSLAGLDLQGSNRWIGTSIFFFYVCQLTLNENQIKNSFPAYCLIGLY